jgi:hypothetical protein
MRIVPIFFLSSLLLLCLTTTVVFALFKVPELAPERRCPACVSFAVALRRASWESHPPFQLIDRSKRKKILNADKRCQELLTEAMDIVLTKQAFVYFLPDSIPKRGENWDVDLNSHILLYFNKTDAPARAIGRFWSLQDLYIHRRLQVADFQKIAQTLQRNTDQSLMHFLHNELREALGDESEALCYLDLYHSKNVTKEEYEITPYGSLEMLTAAGKPFDLNADWLELYIQKDHKADEQDAVVWAYKLCKGKDICGKDAEEAFQGRSLSKKEKTTFMKDFIHSMFPIHPPKLNPRDFSDDPEKASGEFLPPSDRPPQVVDEYEMRETYQQMAEKGGINVQKSIRIESNKDEKPMLDEEY